MLAVPGMSATASTAKSEKKRSNSQAGSQLEGRVVGPDGKPMRDAVVTVRSLDGVTTSSSLPSDRRGQFHLRGLQYGWADLVVTTPQGEFLGDQAINLPPGTRVVVKFDLLETADKPASWWTDRRVEVPSGVDLT